MAKQDINIGTAPNDGTGDPLRTAFDKTNDNFTELYNATGWNKIYEATTQTLVSGDNLITISGTIESNGTITLLDANGKVTPVQINDMIAVDFGCTVVTPATTNQWVKTWYNVNGTSYRAITTPLIKGSGVDHEISISGILPVGADFNTNGLEVYIEASTGLDIKDKYINAGRIHLAI